MARRKVSGRAEKSPQSNAQAKSASHTSAPSREIAVPVLLSDELLRGWPLSQPREDDDKEARGRVLVVGGSTEMPGALILAATAALRAGAGKLRIATVQESAQVVAAAVPEARVFSLNETKSGAISANAAGRIAEEAEKVKAVLIGPGMIDAKAVKRLMLALLPRIKRPTVILDAEALSCFAESPKFLHKVRCMTILTPHAEEMAEMIGRPVSEISRKREETAREVAKRFRAVLVLKGRETLIASPEAELFRNCAGNAGLATSGSGDVLSGIITGLAARGCQPLQAAAWGVYLHARAGDRLAERVGPLGYLARELSKEVPRLMSELSPEKAE